MHMIPKFHGYALFLRSFLFFFLRLFLNLIAKIDNGNPVYFLKDNAQLINT